MHTIKHLFHISKSRADVFAAISTIEGLSSWWTKTTTGDTSVGGTINFLFNPPMGFQMKVMDSIAGTLIKWQCITGPPDWIGNVLTIELDENDGKTRVRFSHDGWKDANDLYAAVTFTWGRYLESLRQYCETGKGEPFGV